MTDHVDRVPYKPDLEPEIENQNREVSRLDGGSYLNNSDFIKMVQFLNLSQAERENPQIAEKVSFLSDWAGRVSRSDDEIVRRSMVKKLKDNLGTTYTGEDLVVYLYRYARLDDEKMKLEGEMSLYKPKETEEPTEKPEDKTEKETSTETPLAQSKPSVSAFDEAKRQFDSMIRGNSEAL